MKFAIIICGSSRESEYNPSVTFQSQLRKDIIIGLHKGQSSADLAKLLNVSEEKISDHLKFLEKAKFVKEKNGRIVPGFFVAFREDVLRTRKASIGLGRKIGNAYETSWNNVIETYRKLSVAQLFDFNRIGFVLVGAYSLDMIDKFAEEGKLMPKAPERKTGSYYMWGVENGMDALGRYGMHSDQLNGYGFASFGGEEERKRVSPPDHRFRMLMKEMDEDDLTNAYQKFLKLGDSEKASLRKKIDEITLRVLQDYERKYRDQNYELSEESEKYLKQWLYLDIDLTPSAPIYTKNDLEIIRSFVEDMSVQILEILYKNMNASRRVFLKCKASKYADFAEFFCWYYHLVFTETMDYLIRKGRLGQPLHGYEFWIWKK